MSSFERTYKQVEAAVRAVAAENPDADWKAFRWYDKAADVLGVPSTYASAWVPEFWKRFQRQALRALRVLASEGTLTEYRLYHDIAFRTAPAQSKAREAEAKREERRAHVKVIRERLAGLGLPVEGALGGLSLENWDRLLDMAEKQAN